MPSIILPDRPATTAIPATANDDDPVIAGLPKTRLFDSEMEVLKNLQRISGKKLPHIIRDLVTCGLAKVERQYRRNAK
jgi:hypothetical protein